MYTMPVYFLAGFTFRRCSSGEEAVHFTIALLLFAVLVTVMWNVAKQIRNMSENFHPIFFKVAFRFTVWLLALAIVMLGMFIVGWAIAPDCEV